MFVGGVQSWSGMSRLAGSWGELTAALCSLYSFTLAPLEGSPHGCFILNNDINRACRKEDLCGI